MRMDITQDCFKKLEGKERDRRIWRRNREGEREKESERERGGGGRGGGREKSERKQKHRDRPGRQYHSKQERR